MMCQSSRRRFTLPVTGILLLALACQAQAAGPVINNLSSRGLQIGTSTLVISGSDLLPEPRLVLPVPIAGQTVKEGATANQVQLEITLDPSVTPGIYPLRLATSQGISGPVAVAIDALAELPFSPEVASLPVAMTGVLEGSSVLRTSFTGQKGQSLVVDVEGRRLGVELNPVLHLLDGRGVQLAYAAPSSVLAGDARIVAQLPADGRYTVELHDALYRGPGPGTFRLKIGTFYFADQVFPLGVRRGVKSPLEFSSTNLPPGTKVESADVPAPGQFPAAWPALAPLSGGRPRVIYSDYEEVVEGPHPPGAPPSGDSLQRLAAPMAVSGRLSAPGQTDRYEVVVTPGAALRFDVLVARAGSPLDGVLSIRNKAGAELANNDDRPQTTDPGLDFTVPAGVDSLVVVISDLEGRGGDAFVYRLSVTSVGQPDFSLALFADREPLPRQGVTLMRVRAARAGYDGPIKLSFAGLPPGVAVTGDEIPAGATDTLVTLQAGDQQLPPLLTAVLGESAPPNVSLRRIARLADGPIARYQPWVATELALAGTQPLPLTAAWEPRASGSQLPLGSALPLEVKVTRAPGAVGAVRLSLLTTQIVPKKTIKENNQDKQVDDLDRAIRIDGSPTIAAEQSTGAASVLVPHDLPKIPYDLAIQAELLAADGKSVVATAVTPGLRMTVTSPFVLALSGEAKVEAKAGSGDTGKLTGTLVRVGQFQSPLVLALEGLPPDLPSPEVTLPADKTEFAFPVSFPFNSPPGAVANVRLVAVARSAPGAVRSNEVPVEVNVVAGGPPPALYRLFEDEPSFVGLLTEGGGQATLESTDRFAGPLALRITPDQKFRSKLPGLGVNIAENPGEGQYRYLRFAWKKRGGQNTLLQLNANGNFGPLRGTPGPAFRYEAGPAENRFNAAAIRLSDKLPSGWTEVTRDLFADFGAFRLDGLAFTPSDGEAALFDHVYLARTLDDLKGCLEPLPAEQPLAVFEDQPEFVTGLTQGDGSAVILPDDKFSGAASVKVTPGQRFSPMLPGLSAKIRENPGPGEYRYLQFAWKKQGGQRIGLQLGHDGRFGPDEGKPALFRYDAGPAPNASFGGAVRLDGNLPGGFVLVTRDLFADFGEFTLTGLSLAALDGDFALFDHIYLGRHLRDFDLVAP
jgi:hypothetical protein